MGQLDRKQRWLALCLVIWGSVAFANERIGNFTLLDQHGKATELYYHSDATAVVLMAYRSDSAPAAEAARALMNMQSQYDNLRVFLINTGNEQRADIRQSLRESGVELPVLVDRAGLIKHDLGFEYAGQALLLDPARWQLVYQGPVLNPASQATDPLARALQEHYAGQPVSEAVIAMPDSFHDQTLAIDNTAAQNPVSYSETIAPILMQKCVDCHRPGGIGPWSMTGHLMVQGFSPMIRETILTKRMPPWHADPEVGHFAQDISLTVEEERAIINWIDAGAPRGDGPDPLAAVTPVESNWTLGEPDLIIDLPSFTVPATGVLDYEDFEVPNPLNEPVWVKAVQIIPGDRQAVHHVIATVGPNSTSSGGVNGNALTDPQLMTFVPGNDVYQYPEGTGLYVPAGSSFHAQMHYTTYGRESSDKTRIGLYFADHEPEHVLQHYAIINPQLSIPAGAREHEESAYYQLQRDAVVYALFPHAHYRGKASSFSFRYPDGREELVLSSPNYDFNWQRYFKFEEPKRVPAGTMIIHRTIYDNSANNPSNPEPDTLVSWGEQTSEEMLYGGISYRYLEPPQPGFIVDPQPHFMTSLALGFLDINMDGRVSLSEMPAPMRDALALTFTMLDNNKSGGLEYDQLLQLITQTPVGEALMDAI